LKEAFTVSVVALAFGALAVGIVFAGIVHVAIGALAIRALPVGIVGVVVGALAFGAQAVAIVFAGVARVAIGALAFGALPVGIVGVVVPRDVARLVNIDSTNTFRRHNTGSGVVIGGELFTLDIFTCGRGFVCSSRGGRIRALTKVMCNLKLQR
jgi:hypothetical protein